MLVHYAIRYRVLEGLDGFLGKWITGWVAAWLGSPVLGHWFSGVQIGNVYIVPALIGGFIGAFLPAAIWKARAKALRPALFNLQETHRAA